MKTRGEIEAAICEGITRFEQEYMGRGPKDIHTYLLGDLLVVRLQGVLTAAEQHMVKSVPREKGRGLLKQVRTELIETARPIMRCGRPPSLALGWAARHLSAVPGLAEILNERERRIQRKRRAD